MKPRDLSQHPEYVPGRGVEEVARERGLDPATLITLSSNENELGPSPDAIDVIKRTAHRAHRYPKSSHADLTEALADDWGVDPQQIWLANGGDGVIDYLSRAVLSPGDAILVPTPGFAYYEMSARFHHGHARSYDVKKEDDFAMTVDGILHQFSDERIVFVTSPHNPSGATMAQSDIETLARETPHDTLVVVDEAYGAFSPTRSAVPLVEQRDDVVVLRSFSKSHGLAGLRLGYGIIPAAWADAFTRVNTPFAANEIACQAGIAALNDTEHVQRTVEMVAKGREYIYETLEARTWESAGNFVLADVGDASEVTNTLMDRGIIVRDCSSFGLPNCIRITIAPMDDLGIAIEACNDVLNELTAVTD